jgi:hypothetical protein
VEWVKRIENLNVRGVRTQGIVRAASFTRTCIVSYRAVGSVLTASAGFPVVRAFSFPSACCADCFDVSSSNTSSLPLIRAICVSFHRSSGSAIPRHSLNTWHHFAKPNRSSMRSLLLEGLSR